MNSPFLVFTTSDSPQRLFGQFVIGGPNCVLFPGCNLTIVRRSIDVLIEASLRQSNSVGILVERIVGTKRVHGTKCWCCEVSGASRWATTPPAG